ncbi:hypothetical protein K0M31_001430, partial [Melipona bicolor]
SESTAIKAAGVPRADAPPTGRVRQQPPIVDHAIYDAAYTPRTREILDSDDSDFLGGRF